MKSVKEIISVIHETMDEYEKLKKLGLSEEEIEGYFEFYEKNFDRAPGSLADLINKKESANER